mgnify:CR=1 FL=1
MNNLHEKSARIYTDVQLLTCNQSITREARQLFSFFEKGKDEEEEESKTRTVVIG